MVGRGRIFPAFRRQLAHAPLDAPTTVWLPASRSPPDHFPNLFSPTHSPLADAVFCFHTAAFAWFARVWAWHLTPAAAYLPGARGFGWFFRYLTFWSFTLQTAALGVCVASHLARAPKRRAALARAADDAACALFGLANVVTIMYFGLEAATAAVVEGGPAPRPRWLGFAVHAGNAATAWADLLLAHPRSFSPRAARGAVGVAAAYSAWLLVVKLVAGAFPYPILEALPQPHGYLCLTAVAVGLLGGLFGVGRALSTPLLRVKTKLGWPTE